MTLTRRSALAATVAIGASLSRRLTAAGNSVNHSVCKWCYAKTPLETLCQSAKDIGLSSIELLGPSDWPMLQKYGLTCAMATNPTVDGLGGITKAFNRIEHHDKLVAAYEDYIPKAAAAGLKNVICFSGNRDGMPDEKGMENCAIGLKRLMPIAEKHKITLVMELLNSKVNHPDYMCDHTEWGVAMCKKVGSENIKLLYDIYHMQIMEGDVIATIKKHNPYIAHYHTGGVPGRHEIDDSQELYYPAIVKAIVETGFKGFVGQEFVPARPDALASLKQGVQICNV
ncbi:hydroxypyruvate isomerase [Bryobacterales bacterium F-183]|nr:hydroxypyruvate isomerase [Bryobacterales bacterium F-183]